MKKDERKIEQNQMQSGRRQLMQIGLSMVGGLLVASKAGAGDICRLTPEQTEGPFYPVEDQADKDADLTSLQGRRGSALGEIITIEGILRDQFCNPVSGVLVEIWQACASGRYNHAGDPNPAPLDPNFQYWGKALTNSQGFYRFKTIKPGAYQANSTWKRPPHIHFKVSKLGYRELITQLYFAGESLNDKDLILKALSVEDQKSVIAPLSPGKGPHPTATFDISIVQIVE